MMRAWQFTNAALRASLLLACLTSMAYGQSKPQAYPEVSDPEALKAYHQFWQAFDRYEEKNAQDSKNKLFKSWDTLKKKKEAKTRRITAEQIAKLEESLKTYKKSLEDHPIASNRPYVLMNAAQVLQILAEVQRDQNDDEAAATNLQEEALVYLNEIDLKHPLFEHRDNALYLKATIYAGQGRTNDANDEWLKLVNWGGRSIYVVYANLALGDANFRQENVGAALIYYKKARTILLAIEVANKDQELLRTEYRTAWAAYRSTDLKTAISMAIELLRPGRFSQSLSQKESIEADAVEIMGDALFENASSFYTEATLKRRDVARYAVKIGLRVMLRYLDARALTEAVTLGKFLREVSPLSRDMPLLLETLASIYQEQGNQEAKRDALEAIAFFLPRQSLWRSKHATDYEAIKNMEDAAIRAAKTLGEQYYSLGAQTGNAAHFATATGFYELLLDHDPNHADANQWRLRVANASFFAGQLDKANTSYEQLKRRHELSNDTLEIAAYQQVLAREQMWRKAFVEASTRGRSVDSAEVQEALRRLEESIDDYANRFAGKGRALDLLLIGASANRDHRNFERAVRYWQRVLVSSPSTPQRSVAIRGLILAKIEAGKPRDVIDVVQKFLRLEDWAKLGPSLDQELKGVLTEATIEEGGQLNKTGDVQAAGVLMITVAQEFKDLPKRERLYRDGAYLLAIAGDWYAAEKAANVYLDEGLRERRDDMMYLKGRSAEYQMCFVEAAETYLALAKEYPNHSRTLTSLTRAENLAQSEGDFKLAAEAALRQGELEKDPERARAAMVRSLAYFEGQNDWAGYQRVARGISQRSKGTKQKLEADLLVAKGDYRNQRESAALSLYARIARDARQRRSELGEQDHAEISGEANFHLGEEAQSQFDDYRIAERSGNVNEKINRKSRYFEQVVNAYTPAIQNGSPRWATEARYRSAETAEAFADELSAVLNAPDYRLTEAEKNSTSATVNRLRQLAKQWHGQNMLARKTTPAQLKNNEWVKKSAVKVLGFQNSSASQDLQPQVPPSYQQNFPETWSVQ